MHILPLITLLFYIACILFWLEIISVIAGWIYESYFAKGKR